VQKELRRVKLSDIIREETSLRGPQADVKKNSLAVQQLKASILQNGLLQPIICRPGFDDNGEIRHDIIILVAGEQRYWCLNQLVREGHTQFEEVDIVLDPNIQTAEHIIKCQITENLDRIQQNPQEVAQHILKVVAINPKISRAELAKMFNRTEGWVSQMLKLDNLSEQGQAALDNGTVKVAHLRIVAELPQEMQDEWLQKYIEDPQEAADTDVDLREFIKEFKKGSKKKIDRTKIPRPRSATQIREIWESLTPDDPKYLGYQHAVRLDAESLREFTASEEEKKLMAQIARDEKKLKDAKEAAERLERAKKDLEKQRAELEGSAPAEIE
jgi:ParB-like chromosome segregation protein Spo0J